MEAVDFVPVLERIVMPWLETVCVFAGSGCGAVLRWQASRVLAVLTPGFPLGTTVVNLVGCFLIGCASAWLAPRGHVPSHWRLLLTTGFLGGFTTFSTFSLETVQLLAVRPGQGMALIVAKVASCLLLTWAGLAVTGRLLGS